MPPELAAEIRQATSFLDYDASIRVRVSYLLLELTAQLACIECGAPIRVLRTANGASKFCSMQCSKKSSITKQKRKNTTIQKYGVDNIFQRTDIIQSAVQSKYGVDNIAKLPGTKEKLRKKSKDNTATRIEKTKISNLEKYGVTHTSKLASIKDKKKATYLANYNAPHYFCSNEFKDKMSEHFNGKNPSQLAHVKDKIKATKQTRYGNENFNNRDKALSTMMATFGCHSSQVNWSEAAAELMRDNDAFRTELSGNTINAVADKFNLAPTTVRNHAYSLGIIDYAHRTNQYESMIDDLLIENNIAYEKNNRKILSGKELDFYIPTLKLAIEVNGIFWHSELMGKDRNYHLAKTEECAKQGIRLIHVWDYQFDNNSELVISMLKSRLGIINHKIWARKTVVRELGSPEYTKFMQRNHIQGSVNAGVRLGLYFNDTLVAAMSFGKSRFAKGEYELLRFASLVGTTVVGGASKLFSYFLKSAPVLKIVSYAERDISVGSVYEALGFQLIGVTPPSYLYFYGRTVYNRLSFQKHKLKDKLAVFDASLTEWENMVNNGFNRCWNTGDLKYEFAR